MVIGSLFVRLRLYESDSLKARRSVALSVKRRLRNRFNVAVAELGPHDDHRSVSLGVTTVGSDRALVVSELQKAADFLDGDVRFEVVERDLSSF